MVTFFAVVNGFSEIAESITPLALSESIILHESDDTISGRKAKVYVT